MNYTPNRKPMKQADMNLPKQVISLKVPPQNIFGPGENKFTSLSSANYDSAADSTKAEFGQKVY